MNNAWSLQRKEIEAFRRIEVILKRGFEADLHSGVHSTGELLSFELPLRLNSPVIYVSPDGEVCITSRHKQFEEKIIPNSSELDRKEFDLVISQMPRGHRPESYATHPAFIIPAGLIVAVASILFLLDWLN